MSEIGVRLLAGANEAQAYLEVETGRCPDLRKRVARGLAPLRIRVVDAESRVVDGCRRERLLLERIDGAPLLPNMRLRIQVALLFAIGARKPKTPPVRRNRAEDGEAR